MTLRSTYDSTQVANGNGLLFHSGSTQNAGIAFTSQVPVSVPVVNGSTSTNNPPFGHLVVGSTQSTRTYVIDPPTAPFGQRLTVFVTAATTVNTQLVKVSTDGSVTVDGTNATITWSTGSKLNTPCLDMVAYSSQRWHIVSYSTTDAVLST